MKIKPMLGEFTLEDIEYIESSESRALVEHRVPGLPGSYFQDMGTVPNTIVIAGSKYGDEAWETFLEGIRDIFNAGKPTTFVADINTATDITKVVIEDLQVAEVGGSPDSFRYMIKIRKYIEPPEPPATGVLDGDILGAANMLTDALDTIDALSSIPNLGNPTEPLRGALGGVKNATGGLDQTVNELHNLFNVDAPVVSVSILDAPAMEPGTAAPVAASVETRSESPASSPERAESGPQPVETTLPTAESVSINPDDPRIDTATSPTLQSMLQAPETAAVAIQLVRWIQDSDLAGILGDDSDIAEQLANAYGTQPSQLIPPGQDAALVLDPVFPLEAPPTILFRGSHTPDLRDDPVRLRVALQSAGQTFELFQQGELMPCGDTASAFPVANLVPSTFCHLPTGVSIFPDQDVCRISECILFDTASSFIAPTADHKRVYGSVVDRIVSGPTNDLLLVVGHTDDIGAQDPNRVLSERRASGALAVLTTNVSVWEANFRSEKKADGGPPWGNADFRRMLMEVNEVQPSAIEIQQHRALTTAGAGLRANLFQGYFLRFLGNISSSIAVRSTTPSILGCGEEHALASGENQPSRRVEFFFVRGSSTPLITCDEYPNWTNLCAISFFVSDSGDDATGDGSLARPWRTIGHALDERRKVTDQRAMIGVLRGTFSENVVLPSETTLEGMNNPLPVVSGTETNKPTIQVNGVRNSKIKNLRIQGGTKSGIRIKNARDIDVSDCEIRENFGVRGGGISVIDSRIINIDNNEIVLNRAGTIDTAVTRLVLDSSFIPLEITAFEIDIGDAHGGGVYLENSIDVRITNSRIHDNAAILFGGGIAVDNEAGFTGFIEISDNQIYCNQVSHGDLSDLEAPQVSCLRDDMADPLLDRMEGETLDAIAAKALRLLHGVGKESGLGGGIALRHVSPQTRLLRNLIGVRRAGNATQRAPNRARRGGGIECYIGAYPWIEGNAIAFNLTSDDGGGIAIDQFDPFLPDNQTQFLGFRRIAMIPRQAINLVNNRVRFNRTLEDGGGIYATGNPVVNITGSDTLIEGNQAQENGGGIRVSYAVRLTMRGARVINNIANVGGSPPFPFDPDREGGGGLAARNAAVSLEDCEFEGNVANEFAGGGIFCNSAFEGGFDVSGFIENQFGQFDRIMERDYGFNTRICVLKNCSGNGNQATGESGAGGYIYAVHVEGEQPLHVTLVGSSTAIGENQSEYERENRRKRGNVVVEFNGQLSAAGLPIDDEVTIYDDIPASPTGIANSTPAPDNRPVVIIHGGRRADDHPTSFPYTNRPP